MRTASALRNIGFVFLALVLASACGDDATGPSREEVAGAYAATSLTMAFPGGSPVDLLALGSEFTLQLNLDGTASGHLFVPDAGEGGGDLDVDLAGTWTLNGSTVTVTPSADIDVFVGDIPLAANGETLVGDRTIDSVRIRVTLTRQ